MKEQTPLRTQIWKSRHAYVLMAPFMLFFAVFTLLPVLISIVIGFTDFNMIEVKNFVGFNNYVRMFLSDRIFLIALRNTLVFAFITGPISYFLCFFLAWLINELGPKMRAVATVAFYAPVLSGQAYTIWLYIFSNDSYGFINSALMQLGLIHEPIEWLLDPSYTLGVVIVVQLWLSLGTSFLAFIAGLQNVDNSLYEAGAIDGISNRLQQLWYITVPSMIPQMIFGAVMQIITSFAVSDVSVRIAGFPSTGYSAETIVTHIMDYGLIRSEMGYACAMASILFLIMYITNKAVTAAPSRRGAYGGVAIWLHGPPRPDLYAANAFRVRSGATSSSGWSSCCSALSWFCRSSTAWFRRSSRWTRSSSFPRSSTS